jgi:hypothetical protein
MAGTVMMVSSQLFCYSRFQCKSITNPQSHRQQRDAAPEKQTLLFQWNYRKGTLDEAATSDANTSQEPASQQTTCVSRILTKTREIFPKLIGRLWDFFACLGCWSLTRKR